MVRFLIGMVLLMTLFGSVSAQQFMEDVVYLKNGSIIRGQIIEQVPGVSLKVKTKDGNVFAIKMEDVEKIERVPVNVEGTGKVKEKSPVVAFVLSFIFPGLGQYYNGEWKKGVIQDVLYIGGYVVAFTAGIDYETDEWGYTYTTVNGLYALGLLTSAGVALWSVIDAPISANKINKRLAAEREYQSNLFRFRLGGREYVFTGLDVSPTRSGGLKAQMCFNF